jgi:hypothetical protein
MSQILYYSSHCENSKKLLNILSKSQIKKEIHFISIDKRVKKNNGATYIVLENSQEIILPPSVTRVPALLLLNKGHHVLFGDEIYNHLKPVENDLNNMSINSGNGGGNVGMQQGPGGGQGGGGQGGGGQGQGGGGGGQGGGGMETEPSAFSLNNNMLSGVMSDNFSFLDQTNEALSAKGDGGMRQLYNYATIEQGDDIKTPPDNYSADTIGTVSLEKMQQERQTDVANMRK